VSTALRWRPRPRALKEIERARGAGVATARAENELEQGSLALEDGQYLDAELRYTEARATLAAR
jgi:hypothetical protein